MSEANESNIAELPPGWAWAKLEDLVDILDGRRVPVSAEERAKRPGQVPYYGATGQVGWIDDFLFDEELVLLGEDGGPFFDKSRNVAYLVKGKSWVNNHAHVLRGRGGMINAFITHQLNVTDYHRFVGGTTRLKLNQAPMRQILFKTPATNEQLRIVETIDELFSDLDAGVAALERVQTRLVHYRAAVLKAAVEGALTAEWRQQHPATEPASEQLARILVERHRRWEEDQLGKFAAAGKQPPKNWKAKYKKPIAPDTSNLPPVPKGWCWATLDQLSWTAGYGTSEKCRETNSGLAVLRIPNIVRGTLDLSDLKYAPTEFKEAEEELVHIGDLLVVRTNGSRNLIGRGAVIFEEQALRMSFASYLIRLRLIPLMSLLGWLSLVWDSSHVRRWIENRAATSAGQFNISLSTLANLPIPIPPEKEQEALIELVEDQFSILDKNELVVSYLFKKARGLRQSILRHAFTGQLVPQDPNDEPAAELLKRIAAEREERERHAHAARRASSKPRTPGKRATAAT